MSAEPATGSLAQRVSAGADRMPERRAGASAAPVVIKIGGRALEAPGSPAELAAEVAALEGPLVLVHGGGAEVSGWCGRIGIEPRFENGLRVTDPATLEVAVAVLAGLANKRLVARLRAAGVDAVGLAGLDGGIVEAAPHPEAARLGAVGAVLGVRRELLDALLAQGKVPVLASIAACAGELLNINADDLAAALAGAVGARELVLLSDAPALRLDDAPVARLGRAGLDDALAHPDVQGGMRPKLAAARASLEAGVGRVWLATWRGPGTLEALLAGHGEGTLFEGGTE
jgi:acetylglutamate kinase